VGEGFTRGVSRKAEEKAYAEGTERAEFAEEEKSKSRVRSDCATGFVEGEETQDPGTKPVPGPPGRILITGR